MAKIFSKIRFLALTIFFATLMLSFKISDIWHGIDGLFDGAIQVAEAQAQTKDASAKNPGDQSEDREVAQKKENAPDADEEEEVSRLITDDPTLLTPAEIEILQQLAVRRDSLDAREREFGAREGLLKAAEERIEKKNR